MLVRNYKSPDEFTIKNSNELKYVCHFVQNSMFTGLIFAKMNSNGDEPIDIVRFIAYLKAEEINVPNPFIT